MKFLKWTAAIFAGLFLIGAFFIVGVSTGQSEQSWIDIQNRTTYARFCRYIFWDGSKDKRPSITAFSKAELARKQLDCPWFNLQ